MKNCVDLFVLSVLLSVGFCTSSSTNEDCFPGDISNFNTFGLEIQAELNAPLCFTSPNYPEPYPPNYAMQWTVISPAEPTSMTRTFNDFYIEGRACNIDDGFLKGQGNCKWDSLRLDTVALCGKPDTLPHTITSTDVRKRYPFSFVTDGGCGKSGFKMTITFA